MLYVHLDDLVLAYCILTYQGRMQDFGEGGGGGGGGGGSDMNNG